MTNRLASVLAAGIILATAGGLCAQDWPQWRGPNRDGKATGFTAPKTWPKELTKKWSVKVGDGVATPALVGDKLYVFSREGGDEIIRCLKAEDGKEIWSDKYPEQAGTAMGGGFKGPRCSPAVADGKVVIMSVTGTLRCYDAAKGTKLWEKNDFKSIPQFSTSSSPMIVNGLCIAQVGGGGRGGRGGFGGGGGGSGGVAAYDLASGDQKWAWKGDPASYASPNLLTLDGTKMIVAETNGSVVALSMDGKQLWKTAFKSQYNASTPVVTGQTVIFSGAGGGPGGGSGGGTTAVKLEKKGDELSGSELWKRESAVQYNSPVVKDGLLYGISAQNSLFCLHTDDGKTAWKTSLGGGGGGGGMMGGSGYGAIVDAGSVLFALNSSGQLIVFEPSSTAFKELAKYKVAKGETYGYPVVSGNRIFIKDGDSVTLYTIE